MKNNVVGDGFHSVVNEFPHVACICIFSMWESLVLPMIYSCIPSWVALLCSVEFKTTFGTTSWTHRGAEAHRSCSHVFSLPTRVFPVFWEEASTVRAHEIAEFSEVSAMGTLIRFAFIYIMRQPLPTLVLVSALALGAIVCFTSFIVHFFPLSASFFTQISVITIVTNPPAPSLGVRLGDFTAIDR